MALQDIIKTVLNLSDPCYDLIKSHYETESKYKLISFESSKYRNVMIVIIHRARPIHFEIIMIMTNQSFQTNKQTWRFLKYTLQY